jgi:hypothetical protein
MRRRVGDENMFNFRGKRCERRASHSAQQTHEEAVKLKIATMYCLNFDFSMPTLVSPKLELQTPFTSFSEAARCTRQLLACISKLMETIQHVVQLVASRPGDLIVESNCVLRCKFVKMQLK